MGKQKSAKSLSSQKVQNNDNKFNLYTFLEVQPKATAEQIKSQYKKLVLKYHPDKNNAENAREQFNKLREAYQILSDPEKRRDYDETGQLRDASSFQSAYEYYRSIYKPLEEEDILTFSKQYRQGKMEEEDLVQFYNRRKGDLRSLLEQIPLSEPSDIPRYLAFFENAFKMRVLKRYSLFAQTKDKVRLLPKQHKKVQALTEGKIDNTLIVAIRNKNKGDFLANLQAKYKVGVRSKATKSKIQKK